jgi:hypothetical protein
LSQERKFDMVPLTGLWKSTTKNGKVMLSARLTNSSRIVILPNPNQREGSNDPAYVLYVARFEHRDRQPPKAQPPQQQEPREPGSDDVPFTEDLPPF